ncbi:tRNA (guanine-N(7)-)-methyltransferase [Candidatus Ruthia magnifica str. Cm (Calyptogena magnifica)]|uniref:tRNA (guanine-N(7)-)-methyltransferase n=1 Tax=Ruthia magnifica subsp. Calyptogena magnifica TaxID=413404 RepID=TRMB_RUTMC|nr:tRNA (guanine-N(7)-)-methyltransferase [Candidatus Ruthturnera calyptogenae]A1AXP6.1 RecName: Full=tRNA (guanine-N(7)-)-methyltransferase; AltName: Full=tRNA (guanine(46)-N(7))-methyltransferase; AltName: Full=tRNA(m7G46)-methyltransferase [Candidatus Ruthia magnifica str. Cm (Calyptogena magnifica)]ABL02703.1 tRNA (guanine-N(7)-)-methyltransferase [Candidatus Ruthia magnifica str. Cm (Calyptogena magnifica)]
MRLDLSKDKINLDALFVKQQKIDFDNGDSLLKIAINMPDINFLDIEIYETSINRLINKTHKYQLSNLKIIQVDAHTKDNNFDSFQLFLSGPWYKKKYHKLRLVQTAFLDLLSKTIIHNGKIHIATDWVRYVTTMMNALKNHLHFKNTQNDPIYSLRPGHRPITKFERRSHRPGHDVLDLIFKNEK